MTCSDSDSDSEIGSANSFVSFLLPLNCFNEMQSIFESIMWHLLLLLLFVAKCHLFWIKRRRRRRRRRQIVQIYTEWCCFVCWTGGAFGCAFEHLISAFNAFVMHMLVVMMMEKGRVIVVLWESHFLSQLQLQLWLLYLRFETTREESAALARALDLCSLQRQVWRGLALVAAAGLCTCAPTAQALRTGAALARRGLLL